MKDPTPLWQVQTVDETQVGQLQKELRIHPIVGRILVARGMGDPEAAQKFLATRLADLPPPNMADLELAVERMGQAVLKGERIGVFGDYDVDGVTSTVLVGDYLSLCGAEVILRVARRDEGYGFSRVHAEEMQKRGAGVLMLVDCGTSDHEAVARAQELGVDVLALDHHQITAGHWPGMALVNPQRSDCPFPYKGLASVGLAFYFIASLRRMLERHGRQVPDPRSFLDLVALGTIADVAPLDGGNRILVANGLQQLRRTERPGLRELLRLCNIADRDLTSTDVGWQLGPRLNAPGRMGDASIALECLRLGTPDGRHPFASQCHAINEQRKDVQGQMLKDALEQAQLQLDRGDTFLLLVGEGWHPGVIGIVASKIVDTFGLPAGIIALDGAMGRGSARSVPGVNLIALLRECAPYLVKFGGHHGAAGFSLGKDQVDGLHQALQKVSAPLLRNLPPEVLKLDTRLELEQLGLPLYDELSRLGPFGPANSEPRFFCPAAYVESARLVGANHLSLFLRGGQKVVPAIGFGLYHKCPDVGSRVDVAFVVEKDEYLASSPRARIRLVDIRPAQGELDG